MRSSCRRTCKKTDIDFLEDVSLSASLSLESKYIGPAKSSPTCENGGSSDTLVFGKSLG